MKSSVGQCLIVHGAIISIHFIFHSRSSDSRHYKVHSEIRFILFIDLVIVGFIVVRSRHFFYFQTSEAAQCTLIAD